MANISFDQERNAVDIITSAMCSLDFLQGITNVIFGQNPDSVTVEQFYKQWLKKQWLKASGFKDIKVPFSVGAIIGCLYCGILLAKEHWTHLLPDEDFSSVDVLSGFSNVSFSSPKIERPTLKYIVRRIQNVLGNGRFNVNVPQQMKDRSEIMTKVTIDFHDENLNDPEDTFDITLNLLQVSDLIKILQSAIHQDVRSRM